MKLSRCEQETIVNYNAGERARQIITNNKAKEEPSIIY